ncbi:hypothetical protein A1O1_02489 [Capronia coronata CBS 617.96]|uniref:Oxidoreductase-like domain-containing protein n=1 Tax=Capronia coronata CBS 617.96 TaxID=1182541 RepID=W9YXU4_9EURO|nr:uncharacterized protein A1O1_02489 [Capronia coronata CBS 617.96]EXJ94096.1 hypothetical protein A1O1_02489 [Capronia coronata CBS 617.96]
MAVPRPRINPMFQSRWTCASCLLRRQVQAQARSISSSAFPSESRDQLPKNRNTAQRRTSHRRSFHSSRPALHEPVDSQHRQAVPLGDFYTDLLQTPLPKGSEADTALPVWVPKGDKTKEERAKQVFGALRGSGYERRLPETPEHKWRTINGVPVPPRPLEPDNCCMSGCVHCVWDDYRDDLELWAARVKEAQAKAQNKSTTGNQPMIQMHRPEVHEASASMDDDGGGSEALWTTPAPGPASSPAALDEDILFQGIPVGIREFMVTEKKIRERKRARREKGLKVDDDY